MSDSNVTASEYEERAQEQLKTIEDLSAIIDDYDERVRDLQTIFQVSRSFDSNDPQKVGEALAATIADKFNAQICVLLLCDPGSLQSAKHAEIFNTEKSLVDDIAPVPQIVQNEKFFYCVSSIGVDPEEAQKIRYAPRNGVLWQRIRAGNPFPVIKFSGAPLYPNEFAQAHMENLGIHALIPLINKESEEVIGLVAVDVKDIDKCRDFLDNLVLLGVRALQNAIVYQELENSKESLNRQIQKLEMLYNVGRALNVIDNRNSLLTNILGHAADIAQAEKGSIMLFEDCPEETPSENEGDSQKAKVIERKLVVRVVRGVGEDIERKILSGEIKTKRLKSGEGVAGKVAETGEPIIINDMEHDQGAFIKSDTSRVNSIMCVPLTLHQDVIGVLNITNKKDKKNFTQDDLRIIEQVANQAAVAIHNSRLYELAVTDGLTGVFIRRHLFQRLNEEIIRANRYNTHLTIVMFDIDFFKKINDSYGHPNGDKVLVEVANVLKTKTRDIDFVGRYGGEEFCLVMPQTSMEEGLVVVNRINHTMEQLEIPLRMKDGENENGSAKYKTKRIKVSISGGLATFPEHTQSISVNDLISCADVALYAAKSAGRVRTLIYNDNLLQ